MFFPLLSSLSISFSADFFLYSTKRWSYGTSISLRFLGEKKKTINTKTSREKKLLSYLRILFKRT